MIKGAKSETAKREEEILQFWKEHNIFEKTLQKDSPKGEYVFYDGPPFATGLPHYGSLLSSVIKDVIPRYKTMRGYHVRRRWGWDCHGLPIENIVEKELGFKSKKDILQLGVQQFNEACRKSVLRYANDWKKYIERIARWVEFDNSYKTMDATYIESVWWALKQIHEKGLLYEGRKVLLYCPRCETPLAKAEVAMDHSYREITEEAVTVKFKVKNPEERDLPENTYLLAWTTTPWTLPGNVALAVGNDIEYVIARIKNQEVRIKGRVIIAKKLFESIADEYEVVEEIKGKELVGIEYEPLFEIEAVKATDKRAWYVSDADFVTTEEGTGIVHTAVIYGEDDYELGLRLDLPMVPLLDASGHFTDAAPEFIRGKYFKASEKFIKSDLEERGLLFKRENHTHSYPHCHRCEAELLYNALSSWFISIQKIKDKLIKLNGKINWFPEHLKHGRFLNTVENAPDWTISRNRFWASPLPFWRNEKSGEVRVLGSVEELKRYTKKSGNRYFLMRHGKAESNIKSVINSLDIEKGGLIEEGRREVLNQVPRLKKEGINLIIASDFKRTKETAQLLQKELGLSAGQILYDARIRELRAGVFDGKPWKEFHAAFSSIAARFREHAGEAENYSDIKKRVMDFLFEIEKRYQHRNILIVSHGLPIAMVHAGSEGLDVDTAALHYGHKEYSYDYAEFRELPFVPFPHNSEYELDLHRPYIDEVALVDEDGTSLARVPEVLDGWVESGSMPFAEYHYPFQNKKEFESRFPADFIAEYIAQTRTWFYYMHVMAAVLFGDVSFKNVVTTGNVLAEDGSKMSKSKGNYTDPLLNIDVFGADALRFYLMESVVMRAEDMRFSDTELREMHNRVVNILWNVFRFYETYRAAFKGTCEPFASNHVLDQWILAKLAAVVHAVTEHLEQYETVHACREIRHFIEEFSTWYIRRSRERFKSSDEEDTQYALATTGYVLREFSKVIAPFTPFLAERIYRGADGKKESVHLESWPKAELRIKKKEFPPKADQPRAESILEEMEEVRRIVSLALEARMRAGIKVRQPLAKLRIKSKEFPPKAWAQGPSASGGDHPGAERINLPARNAQAWNLELSGKEQLIRLVMDEVNVKEVLFDESIEGEISLDTAITEGLKEEGDVRELIRYIQELRKKKNLTPTEKAELVVKTNDSGKSFINAYEQKIREAASLSDISFDSVEGEPVSIGIHSYAFLLKK